MCSALSTALHRAAHWAQDSIDCWVAATVWRSVAWWASSEVAIQVADLGVLLVATLVKKMAVHLDDKSVWNSAMIQADGTE